MSVIVHSVIITKGAQMHLGEPRATAYLARNIVREGKEHLPQEIIRGLSEFSRLVHDEHEGAACTMLHAIFAELSLPTATQSRDRKQWPDDLIHAFTAFTIMLSSSKWMPADRLKQKIIWYLMSR